MSEKKRNIFVIEAEERQQCDMCGKIDELRPYGPNGECLCFDCGMKDENTTRKIFKEAMDNPQ